MRVLPKQLLIFIFLSFILSVHGQRKTTSSALSLDPSLLRVDEIPGNQAAIEDLVLNDLLGGGCLEVRNIRASSVIEGGNYAQIGRFVQDANLDINLASGIVLSTGRISDAQGPNTEDGTVNINATDADTPLFRPGDPEITNSRDAAVIEFEFRPTGNSISFNYVFASEEYPEFVCQFNDEFAFFIRRAGTTDPLENIALIPGTTQNVTIDNVNDQFGQQGKGCVTVDHSGLYNSNLNGSPALRYDGFTDVFTATKDGLNPCEWYYFRIVVADVTDMRVDSAVFLEANSFSDGSPVNIGASGTVAGTADAIEGCKGGMFTFTRGPNNDINQDFIINFNISGTATEGTDYQTLPRTVTIPAGQATIELPVLPIADTDATEGSETIILETTNINCDCGNIVITSKINIQEYDLPITTLNPAICQGQDYTLPDGTVVNQPGPYTTILPRVKLPDCDSLIVTNLTVNPNPVANASSQQRCSDSNTADFDLPALNTAITGGAADRTVTFHNTLADAENNVNPIASPFNSAAKTIFARVEDDNTQCTSTSAIALSVNLNPVAQQPTKWEICDTDNDGAFSFDLSQKNSEILGALAPADYNITYHISQADADNDANPVAIPFSNTSNPQTIYARLETNASGCYDTESFEVEVFNTPLANTVPKWEVCDNNNDGTFDLDLTTRDATILGGQNANDYNITYHRSQADADNSVNALTSPFSNTANPQTIFVRIENKLKVDCYDTSNFQVEIFDSPTANAVQKWDVCDDNNDDQWQFDLSTRNAEVLGAQNAAVFTVKYYLTEADADADTNAINGLFTNAANPQTIWARIENNGNTVCYDKSSFQLEVFNTPLANTVPKWEVCDNNNDGTFDLDLTTRDATILGGQNANDYNITYHRSQADADNSVNALTSPFSNTANPQTIFVRIENKLKVDCYDTSNFQVEIFDSPTANAVQKWDVCDDNNDDQWQFDLSTRNAEVLGAQNTAMFTVKYYETEADADADTNAINGLFTNAANPQTIWARIENNGNTVCYDKNSFQLQVFNTPTAVDTAIPIATCSAAPTAEFDLTEKEDDVANFVPGMTVTYYRTRADAQARINPILNAQNYIGTTGSVFAVVEDPANNNCSAIAEIQLEVLNVPQRRDPNPLEACSSNGLADFDIESVRNYIVNGQANVTVSFHKTFADADAATNGGLNPIVNLTAYNSPTATVFARSEADYQGRICHNVSEVRLVVNDNPVANDDVYRECSDTPMQNFNLDTRAAIITGGIANRTVTFFSTRADAEQNTVANQLPSVYNSANATVFARVLNTVTGCTSVSEVSLLVIERPNITGNIEITECFRLGVVTFDLAAERARLQGINAGYDYEFFATQAEAVAGNGPQLPDQFVSGATTIFVRISVAARPDCHQIKPIDLKVDPVPVDDRGDKIICIGRGFTLPGGQVVFQPGLYEVPIQDPTSGCDILTRTNLIVGEILFPTAFTPNANSENDVFQPMPNQQCALDVTNYQLKIWNRWGELVYETTEYTNGWKGDYENRDAAPGVYMWMATYTFRGQDYEQKGAVTLLR